MSDDFYIFIGYFVYALLAWGVWHFLGGWGVFFFVGFFVVLQIIYRIRHGKWYEWEDALKD